jgi:uncharacterized RDD family membrane protein YckC
MRWFVVGVAGVCIAAAALISTNGSREVAFTVIALDVLAALAIETRNAWHARDRHGLGSTDVVGRRVVAHIIDWIVPALVWLSVQWLSYQVAWRSGVSPRRYQDFIGNGSLALAVLLLADFVLLQGATGYTVGKWLLRIRTVDEDGSRPGMRRVVIRTLPLLIEQVGLVALFAMARSPRHQRYGDRFAHTLVVRT